MKISAKDREDAEVLCLLRADVWFSETRTAGAMDANLDPRLAVCASDVAIRLSTTAWFACFHKFGTVDYGGPSGWCIGDLELEAAALLRDGWCPGDPVVRLGR